MENLYDIFSYISELFVSSNPLDEKMNVLLGIATYSYKRFLEIYNCQMFNSISGRGCVRALIEDYIMMKYLVKNESSHNNIWHEYQLYGIGAYKLVLARYRESNQKKSPFDAKYIEALVNEFKYEEFIDMDTKYFDNQNIRLKAESVRESSLLKCNNPTHQFHCIPDIDDKSRLKTVLPDCVMVMNKTISLLNEIYGIPEKIFDEVINFEIKSVVE